MTKINANQSQLHFLHDQWTSCVMIDHTQWASPMMNKIVHLKVSDHRQTVFDEAIAMQYGHKYKDFINQISEKLPHNLTGKLTSDQMYVYPIISPTYRFMFTTEHGVKVFNCGLLRENKTYYIFEKSKIRCENLDIALHRIFWYMMEELHDKHRCRTDFDLYKYLSENEDYDGIIHENHLKLP